MWLAVTEASQTAKLSEISNVTLGQGLLAIRMPPCQREFYGGSTAVSSHLAAQCTQEPLMFLALQDM